MKSLLNVSLQTKIMGLVVSLVVGIIVVLLVFFIYYEIEQSIENSTRIGLQTSKTIANMNSVEEAINNAEASNELQALAIRISNQVDANFIVIEDREGRILAHPKTEEINTFNSIEENYKAVVFGGYYSLNSDRYVGSSIVGKSPVFNDEKQVIGVVTVGYLKEEIYNSTFDRLKMIFIFAIFVIILGVVSSVLLARNIRKDTLDLEPREIATLYRDRNAILSSINEGIIAMDNVKRITLMNQFAQKILGLNNSYENRLIYEVLNTSELLKIIESNKPSSPVEIDINGYVVIMNLSPILKDERKVGTVITLKDKTEILELVNTLSEVQKFSDDLRAQTHEFQNKLYVISGLLQLGYHREVLDMIKSEMTLVEQNNKLIFDQIKDVKIQALLFGKIGKASEKKINFEIEENSTLEVLPAHISVSGIITIIGNLIDNAFEAVARSEKREVIFFTIDFGEEIVMGVTDTGPGIPEEAGDLIFGKGFSTKSDKGRGFGLPNVRTAVEELNGSIEVSSTDAGTTFTVFIPKNK